jgi:hypothetical protein
MSISKYPFTEVNWLPVPYVAWIFVMLPSPHMQMTVRLKKETTPDDNGKAFEASRCTFLRHFYFKLWCNLTSMNFFFQYTFTSFQSLCFVSPTCHWFYFIFSFRLQLHFGKMLKANWFCPIFLSLRRRMVKFVELNAGIRRRLLGINKTLFHKFLWTKLKSFMVKGERINMKYLKHLRNMKEENKRMLKI